MPRGSRLTAQSQIYHIMLRGNNKENIFIDGPDKSKLKEILIKKRSEGAFRLYAYCIMDNHLHLVIKEGTDTLSTAIKRIGISYARYFNRKYGRVGHVFQDRYKSECIEDERYLLSVIRYIHQNPLKAGISSIHDYPWSSYQEYLKPSNLVAASEILDIFSLDLDTAVEKFVAFNHETTEEAFKQADEYKEIHHSQAEDMVIRFLSEKNLSREQLKQSDYKETAKELVLLLLKNTLLSQRSIATVSGINREMVRTWIKDRN